MIVRITKPVPGYVNGMVLRKDQVMELENSAALSLINDGYAAPVERSTPADRRETASDKRPPGRPRKTEG